MRHFLLIAFFCVLADFPLLAQSGCTDALALNFDPAATTNDGSCQYPVTNYSLVFKANLPTELKENSGLVMANGGLWTHNDGGSNPEIYQIDSLTGAILQTVSLTGAQNVDWEDIAFDGTNFYVGDFGNNANGNRTDLRIYKFPFSAIPSGTNVSVPQNQISVINFSYQDQTNFDPTGSNNTSFDCESMIVKNGVLHLFTKDWLNYSTTHYSLPNSAGTYQAQKLESFDAKGLVTAADISSQGVLLLLGYNLSTGSAFYWQVWDFNSDFFFAGNKRRIELGSLLTTGQVEGICFRNNRYGYVSNELFLGLGQQRLFSFEIGLNQLSPVSNIGHNKQGFRCRISPNPIAAGISAKLIDPPAGDYLFEIWNAQGQAIWQGKVDNGDLPTLPSGVYFLQVRDERGDFVCRNAVLVR